MRFLKAVALGLLASQAQVASALKAYTLGSSLHCSSNADTVHFDYSLQGLDSPPNFPGTDIYEVAYHVTYANTNTVVSVPVTAVAAQDGTGRSDIQFNNGDTNKDNVGATFANLPMGNGTILHHQQVNGVSQVTGFFEISAASATTAGITCTNSNPNIQLTPLSYTINGIPALVLNSYSIAQSAYSATVGGGATAANPVYSFDINPGLNIDSCYTDPNTGNTRVPWRVGGLAILGDNERGIVSLLVTNPNGDLVSSFILQPDALQYGSAVARDPAEPSIIQASQVAGPAQIYGRLDFQANDPAVTCDAFGNTNLLFQVVDYSTINLVNGAQTFHFIPGSVDFGLDTASQLSANSTGTIVAAAATTTTQAPPSAAKVAARNARAKKCAAKAKADAAAAAAAAVVAAAAAAVAPGSTADNPCLLTVPANMLTAAGLATPYILGGGCDMANLAGFVQAVWISPATGTVQMYNPLVIQQGKTAAVKPQQPVLPADAVVGLWFGSNANFQQLQAPANAPNILAQSNCVNGAMINGKMSLFGQIAACNAPAFFQAAAIAVFQGLLTVPPLGTAIDQMPCPTTRSFFVVDQDPADNLSTQYLLDANGNTAINTPGNLATLTAAATAAKKAPPTVLVNPGDNPLLNRFINPTMKCNSWMVTDLSNPGTTSFNQALNEVSAAFKQGSPVARQPALNPMCAQAVGMANMGKLNACRSLIGEAPVQNLNQASTATFCKNMVGTNGAVRLLGNQKVLAAAAGPVAGQSLFAFLQGRFAAAVGPCNLGCGKLVPGLTNPLAGGAVIAAAAAFSVSDALLVGSSSPDNQPMDPVAELSGQPIQNTSTGSSSTFPVAIVAGAVGGAVVLLVASIVLFKVVQRRKNHTNVKATTARESKV